MAEILGRTHPPGSTIRYKVVDSRLGSGSTWSLTTKKDTNDVYVTQRESGEVLHCSFHHSGVSQHTLTDAAHRDNPSDFSRHLLVTRERTLVAPDLYHAHQVIVAHSELSQTYVEKKRARSFLEVPIHPNFDAVNLNLYLADGQFPLVRIDKAVLVADMELGGGGSALLVAQPGLLEHGVHHLFSGLIDSAKKSIEDRGIRNQETRFVLMLTDHHQMGTKVEVEVKLFTD